MAVQLRAIRQASFDRILVFMAMFALQFSGVLIPAKQVFGMGAG
jgi:hypothetical protein